MKKKYQIFISSTYQDLKEERQAAVEAILKAGHIPAGMELFSSGNKTQLEIIKKWIEESDIFVLILGGRYGTLESESQKSYTELEYRYAIELEKPFFAIVMDEKLLDEKNHSKGKTVLELDNPQKYKDFKDLVLSKMCRFFENITEVKLGILESIIDLQNESDLIGWVRASQIQDNSQLLTLIEELRIENQNLIKKNSDLETINQKPSKSKTIGDYTFDEIKAVLTKKKINIPASLTSSGKEIEKNAMELFVSYRATLNNGVTNRYSNETQIFLTNNLVPLLMNFGLMERSKIKVGFDLKVEADKFNISALGNKFLSIYELEEIK